MGPPRTPALCISWSDLPIARQVFHNGATRRGQTSVLAAGGGPLSSRHCGGRTEGLFETVQYILVRKVRNRPVDLARLKDAIVPRAAVGDGIEPLDPEVPETPVFNGQRSVSGAAPPMLRSVGRQKEAFTIPAVRRSRAGRQHIRGGVENRPLLFMLRAVNDQVLFSLIRALAPPTAAQNLIWRTE